MIVGLNPRGNKDELEENYHKALVVFSQIPVTKSTCMCKECARNTFLGPGARVLTLEKCRGCFG